jgi:hypothetical protein
LAQVIHDPDRVWTVEEVKELIHEHVETLLNNARWERIFDMSGRNLPTVTAKIVPSEKMREITYSAAAWSGSTSRPVSMTLVLTLTHHSVEEET